MIRQCLTAWLAVTVLVGVLNAQANAGYLFGWTGGSPNFLEVTTVTGARTLSTATNPLTAFSNNQGWWSLGATSTNDNDNFFVGNDDYYQTSFNNYFTFDISALKGQTVTGVVLNIQNPGINGSSATYFVHDVSTDAATLNAKSANPNGIIFTDLGTGALYGQKTIPLINDTQYWITLNAAAVNDLNAAITSGNAYFSVGGTLNGAVVPEPSGILIAAMGLLTLSGRAMWKRRRSAAE